MHLPQEVLDFWFGELRPAQWWARDPALDASIGQRFGAVHQAAARCELHGWRSSAAGRLAEIIVLDQFSRNMFRDRPQAFAQDPLALALAQEAVARGCDRELDADRRVFLYLPYMHSESPAIHLVAQALFATVHPDNYRYELQHKAIIDRFGRYPHRNAILGRPSTAEELAFLQQPGSSF